MNRNILVSFEEKLSHIYNLVFKENEDDINFTMMILFIILIVISRGPTVGTCIIHHICILTYPR